MINLKQINVNNTPEAQIQEVSVTQNTSTRGYNANIGDNIYPIAKDGPVDGIKVSDMTNGGYLATANLLSNLKHYVVVIVPEDTTCRVGLYSDGSSSALVETIYYGAINKGINVFEVTNTNAVKYLRVYISSPNEGATIELYVSRDDVIAYNAISSEAFVYSSITKTNGNITSCNIVWPDGISGTMTVNYTDSLITSIVYTRGTNTYRQNFVYNSGEVSSTNIEKVII